MWDRNRERQSEIRNCWCFGLSPQKQQQQEAPASHAVGVPCSSTRRFRRPSWSGPSEPALEHSSRPPSDTPRPFALFLVTREITLGFLASGISDRFRTKLAQDAEAWLSRRLRLSLLAHRHDVQVIRLYWDGREALRKEHPELLQAVPSAAPGSAIRISAQSCSLPPLGSSAAPCRATSSETAMQAKSRTSSRTTRLKLQPIAPRRRAS